jgi:hypothetical protein
VGYDERSPVQRELHKSLVDDQGVGKPLSRRARQTKRTVEAYLSAGVMPRYMERLREIDSSIAVHRRRLERSYRILRDAYGHDAELFARRWRAKVDAWPFERLNELIREHNDWYPVEASLPLDPRTGDYVRFRGRSYRREELGPEWVLEQFPVPRGVTPVGSTGINK